MESATNLLYRASKRNLSCNHFEASSVETLARSMISRLLLHCIFTLSLLTPLIGSQQTYSGNSVLECNGEDKTGPPSPDFLYTCNGRKNQCRAFLIFKSSPPFNSVPTISTLLSSDEVSLARINNVTRLTVFPTNKEVIVPVSCSCSGQYYHARTRFRVPSGHDTFFTIANDTFQGLASCDSLKSVNLNTEDDELKVPLRCACPTRNQTGSGTRFLLTYLVSWEDTIRNIGRRFNVTEKSILDANGLVSNPNPTIFPFTTILIPLRTKPSSSQTRIQYPRPTVSPPTTSPAVPLQNKTKKKLYILGLGLVISCCVLCIVVLSSLFLMYKWRKETRSHPPHHQGKRRTFLLPVDLRIEIAGLEQFPRLFRFEQLKKATRNFSSRNRLEGSVYRGKFGKETLAVKKMAGDVSKEVNILKKTNHFNLVQLRGFCEVVNGGGSFLVFEYMSNGSLRDWLREKSSKKIREWSQRVQIALDVANGLHYLHNFTEPPYVHMNINSSNVLLNGNLRGKIGNFSLAEVVTKKRDDSGSVMSGGPITEVVSPKVDVYEFGVIMLELITGKELVLSESILSEIKGEDEEGCVHSFIDPRLKITGEGFWKLAMKMVKLSLNCLEEDPSRRPVMEEIVSSLLMIQLDLLSTSLKKGDIS